MPNHPQPPTRDDASRDPTVRRYVPAPDAAVAPVAEIGGRKDGTEPTRFGDWEKKGRCIDF